MKKSSSRQNTVKAGAFLGARFRFHAVAALLKLQCEQQTTRPLRVKLPFADQQPLAPFCPYCDDSEFRVYRRAQDDEWGCCPECGFATDPVGLIAHELRCSPKEAVEYLVFQHNLRKVDKEEIETYLWHRTHYGQWATLLRERLHVDYSLRHRDAEHGLNPNSLHRLLDKLDLCQAVDGAPDINISLCKPDHYRYLSGEHTASDTDPRKPNAFPYWRNRRGLSQGLFGVADHMTVESWFFPNLYSEISGRIRPNTSPMRLFHGPGWGLVLVVPLQDVPGHFCGALFIGRDGNYPRDYVIRLFPDFGRRTDDAGFIMPMRAYRAIARSELAGRGEVVAYNNPLHLLRTHYYYYRLSDLPLIGWIDDLENASHIRTVNWSPFRSIRNKVFWMQSHQHWTVRSAIENDAKVMLYAPFRPYPKDAHPSKGFQTFHPTWNALERMASDALPWAQYLDAYCSSKPLKLAIEELKLITLTPQRFETCVAQLPPSSDVRRLIHTTPMPCQIKVGQYDVFEEAAGIFRKTPRQVSPVFVTDAKCFLDQVYFTARRVRKIYRGRILFGGRTVTFDTPVNIFDKDPMGTVSEMIRNAGLSEPTFCCKNRFYNMLVKAMSPLKPIEAIASIGWSGRTKMLEFPQFQIARKRGVIAKPERAKLLPDDFPAKYLEPPSLIAELPAEIETAECQSLSQWLLFFTPLLSACAAPAIFPAVGKKLQPILISGCDESLIKPVTECLGIPTMPMNTDDDRAKIAAYCKQHRWSVLATCSVAPTIDDVARSALSKIHSAMVCLNDPDLCTRAARCNSGIVHVAMGAVGNITEPNWQILAPLVRSLFFSRLKEHLERPPQHESVGSFAKDECRYWGKRILSLVK